MTIITNAAASRRDVTEMNLAELVEKESVGELRFSLVVYKWGKEFFLQVGDVNWGFQQG